MRETPGVLDGDRVVAREPHCGVCQHVVFHEEDDSDPHCRKWNRPPSTTGGDVCPAFQLHEDADVTRPEVDADVEIDWNRPTVGTEAPFYTVEKDDEAYSWLCGNCRTTEVAVDTMGRIVCSDCSNSKRPTDWDSAYL